MLNLIDYEFIILMWIDNWGVQTGWWIRGAMIAGGVVLCLIGAALSDPESEGEGDFESQ